jgi:hypothetical protein
MKAATANAVAAGSGQVRKDALNLIQRISVVSCASGAPGSIAVSRAGFSALEIVKLFRQSENPTDDALDMPEGIAAELAGFADLHEPTLHDVFPSVLEPLLAADEFQMIFPNVLISVVG